VETVEISEESIGVWGNRHVGEHRAIMQKAAAMENWWEPVVMLAKHRDMTTVSGLPGHGSG
jgi:hypothetical protein